MAANFGLAYPNRCADGLNSSGGSWTSAAPLANILDTQVTLIARTTDATEASTKFTIDLAATRACRAFWLKNHNLSSAGQWRIKLGTTSGGSEAYSGSYVNAWQLSLEAGLSSAGINDDDYQSYGFDAVIVLPAAVSFRYLTVEISDTSNPDGYVQIGRVGCAGVYVPPYNPVSGSLAHTWVDLSSSSRAESGERYTTPRRRYRQSQMLLDALDEDSADTLHEMQRHLGTVTEVYYLPDLNDAEVCQRYGYLAHIEEMTAIEYPYSRARKLPLKLSEIV